jgi:dihydroneopterin aldolase
MKILIEELTFDAILGILDIERTTPQKVRITCIIDYSYSEGHFINYADVASLIETTVKQEQFELIETALEKLSIVLKEQFPLIETLTLTLYKPTILPNATVGVSHCVQFVHNSQL